MDIILTESQYIKLLLERHENKMSDVLQDNKSIVQKIISDVKSKFGIDFTFLGTWGSVIGGFVGPISDYMANRYPNLSETDISLITFGIILTFFSSNKEKLNKVLQLIKEKKLVTFFDRALSKAYDLKEAFFNFLESLNVTFSKVSSMIAYAFLIPLMPLLKDMVSLDMSKEQIDLLVMGLTHYTGLSISSSLLYNIVKKIIERFKTVDNDSLS